MPARRACQPPSRLHTFYLLSSLGPKHERFRPKLATGRIMTKHLQARTEPPGYRHESIALALDLGTGQVDFIVVPSHLFPPEIKEFANSTGVSSSAMTNARNRGRHAAMSRASSSPTNRRLRWNSRNIRTTFTWPRLNGGSSRYPYATAQSNQSKYASARYAMVPTTHSLLGSLRPSMILSSQFRPSPSTSYARSSSYVIVRVASPSSLYVVNIRYSPRGPLGIRVSMRRPRASNRKKRRIGWSC
jgi:hypothetical protein